MAPMQSIGVATTSASMVLPPSSPALMASPSIVLAIMVSPSLSSHPRVSLDHLYTSSNVDSLWGATYKLKQKTSVGFVSTFDKNLIRLAGVQNATDSTKIFFQRSLEILEENGQWYQEAVHKVASLEAEVAKWRATARTLWLVESPKVANATVAFVEVIRSNHQLSLKVDGVLAKLLRTKVDGDELFKCCKDLQMEKKEVGGMVESMVAEGDGLAKIVSDL